MLRSVPYNPHTVHDFFENDFPSQVKVFLEPNYTENFVQCILDSNLSSIGGSTLVVGGDGRYFCKEATELIIRICAANGVSTLVSIFSEMFTKFDLFNFGYVIVEIKRMWKFNCLSRILNVKRYGT